MLRHSHRNAAHIGAANPNWRRLLQVGRRPACAVEDGAAFHQLETHGIFAGNRDSQRKRSVERAALIFAAVIPRRLARGHGHAGKRLAVGINDPAANAPAAGVGGQSDRNIGCARGRADQRGVGVELRDAAARVMPAAIVVDLDRKAVHSLALGGERKATTRVRASGGGPLVVGAVLDSGRPYRQSSERRAGRSEHAPANPAGRTFRILNRGRPNPVVELGVEIVGGDAESIFKHILPIERGRPAPVRA